MQKKINKRYLYRKNNMEQIDRALDAALIIIKNGGSTINAERTFKNILNGYRISKVYTAWRLDFVTASTDGAAGTVTVMRPVGAIGVNLTRTSEAEILGERVSKGEVSTDNIISEIERIKAIAPPYNRWLMMLFAAFAAATFTQIMNGDWGGLGIAFIAAGIGQILRSQLQGMDLTVAQVTFGCGVLSASIAALGLRLGFSQDPASALISSVIYLVPGLPLINGFIDIISHKYLFIGLGRIANAMFLFLILAIAIAFGIVFIT